MFRQNDITEDMAADIARAKMITSFFDLIKYDETALRQELGLVNDIVVDKLGQAISNWLEKYRFPGTFLLLCDLK